MSQGCVFRSSALGAVQKVIITLSNNVLLFQSLFIQWSQTQYEYPMSFTERLLSNFIKGELLSRISKKGTRFAF